MNVPSICIVDVDTGAGGLDLIAAALTKQFTVDFPTYWNAGATLRAAMRDKPQASDEQVVYLRDEPIASDAQGELGYHTVTPTGLPIANVFKGLCDKYGDPLSVVIGHEAAEMIADPDLALGYQDPRDGLWWALEVCDAVEGDTYEIDKIPVTNFCTRAWFKPPQNLAGAKFDMLGRCRAAWEVRPNGGYAQKYDHAKGWQMIGQMRPYRAHLAALGLSRGARR